MSTLIDVNTMSWEATDALIRLDDSFIGTENYLGLSYFWSCEYKWPMREASYAKRRQVHRALLKAGLVPWLASDEHKQIIYETLGLPLHGCEQQNVVKTVDRRRGEHADTYKCKCGQWEWFNVAYTDGITYECLLTTTDNDKLVVLIGQEHHEQERWNGHEPTVWCEECDRVVERELIFNDNR